MRTVRLALAAAAALAATGARAQWRAEPMVLWLDGPRDVVAGELGGSAGLDLLVLDESSSASRVLEHGRLLAPQPGAFAFSPPFRAVTFRAGRLAQPGGADPLADVARVGGNGLVEVAFGSAPGTVQPLTVPEVGANDAVGFVHLLPRAADVLVVPMQASEPTFAGFAAYDFDPGAASSSWRIGGGPAPDGVHLTLMSSGGVDVAGIRLSDVARASGIEDVALLGLGGLVLNVHVQAPQAASLAAVRLSGPIEVGGNRDQYDASQAPPWLPATVPLQGDTLGVAALDVDLDGDLDLVFAQSRTAPVAGGAPQQARVVWAEGTGNVADFGDPALTPWRDLGLALGLTAPLLVRQVSAGGEPAIATWDHAAQQAVVVWNDGGIQRVWRGRAPGRRAIEILAADVAGSPADDLVVVVENGARPGTVYVYPDVGEPGPILAWAPGSPGTPVRGVAHTVTVALDPAGAPTATIDWMEGLPTTAPVASGEGLLSHQFDPDCAASPGPLTFTVRATDAHGVFAERTETLLFDVLEPALSLRGASPPRRLVLPPGGTTAVVDGVAATGCGGATFGGAWPAGATVTDEVRPASIVRTVDLPETVYPALLADPALVVSLATTDAPGPPRVVSLALELDASGLVQVTQSSDRTSLAEGGLAVVRTTLRSRLGVPLPAVRVTSALTGLVGAGPPSVSGAAVVSSAADGTDLVLDALPPGGAEVTIDLPVRAAGGAQGAAAAEVRSSGGWLLTPAARPEAEGADLPGCGCGAGTGSGWLALVLLALTVRRRR